VSAATRFGRFLLRERRATGGMGEVWRATLDGPRGFSQPVIIKRIRPDLRDDAAIAAMFAAEARAYARLDHPSIVKVFEFGEVDGEPYLAMELVDGWTLAEVMAAFQRAGRAVPIGLACHVGACVADALDHAHALADDGGHPYGLVHRDISPTNVMVTRHGAVKVLDFGAHAAVDRDVDDSGLVRGTPAYMSPEQADGRSVDARSDVFSLGVVLYEALTSTRLFAGADDRDTLRQVREASVPPIERADLEPALGQLVAQMLARVPADRPRSCAAIARVLRDRARREHVDDAAVRQTLSQLGLDRLPGRAATQLLLPDRRRSRRGWWLALALTAGAAAPYACTAPPRTILFTSPGR
jgi:serine/threonine protein kinase